MSDGAYGSYSFSPSGAFDNSSDTAAGLHTDQPASQVRPGLRPLRLGASGGLTSLAPLSRSRLESVHEQGPMYLSPLSDRTMGRQDTPEFRTPFGGHLGSPPAYSLHTHHPQYPASNVGQALFPQTSSGPEPSQSNADLRILVIPGSDSTRYTCELIPSYQRKSVIKLNMTWYTVTFQDAAGTGLMRRLVPKDWLHHLTSFDTSELSVAPVYSTITRAAEQAAPFQRTDIQMRAALDLPLHPGTELPRFYEMREELSPQFQRPLGTGGSRPRNPPPLFGSHSSLSLGGSTRALAQSGGVYSSSLSGSQSPFTGLLNSPAGSTAYNISAGGVHSSSNSSGGANPSLLFNPRPERLVSRFSDSSGTPSLLSLPSNNSRSRRSRDTIESFVESYGRDREDYYTPPGGSRGSGRGSGAC